MKRRWFVLAWLLVLGAVSASPSLFALSELETDAGLTLFGNTDPSSAPSPLMPTLGVNLTLGKPLGLEVGVLAWGTYYMYADGRATPAELEFRDYWVLGLLADARIGYTYRLGETAALGANGGLALLLRAPIPLPVSATARDNLGSTFGYLYGMLRFVYPEVELFGRFRLTDDFDLRLSVRGYFPLFHLWDGEALPFGDQLMVSMLVGLVFALPPKN